LISFTPDGNLLVTVFEDNTVNVIDLWKKRKTLNQLKGHRAPVINVGFSRSKNQMITVSLDGTSRLWSLKQQTGQAEILKVIPNNEGQIRDISFNPQSNKIAFILENGDNKINDKSIQLLDLNKNQKVSLRVPKNKQFFSLKFSPDGKSLAASSESNSVYLWKLEPQKTQFQPQKILIDKKHESSNNVWSISFNPKKYYQLAAVSGKGEVSLLNLQTGQTYKKLRLTPYDDILNVEFSPDGQKLAINSANNVNAISLFWDLDKKNPLHSFVNTQNLINSISFSRDGQLLGAASRNSKVGFWKVDDFQKHDRFSPTPLKILLEGHRLNVRDLSFSSDSQEIATASDDGTVRLWDLQGGASLITFRDTDTNAQISSVGFSQDNQWIASGSTDGNVYLRKVLGLDESLKLACEEFKSYFMLNPDIRKELSVCNRI
jgi:WD40 repeat protein